jgi:hypothetical protein
MKETVNPKIEALKMMVYGQYSCTKDEYDKIYDDFMKNMDVF